MKFNKPLFIMLSIALLTAAFSAQAVGLQDAAGELKKVGEAAYGAKTPAPLPELVGKYIRIFLGLVGVLFAVLMVYGGYTWMTSFGNTQKIEKAKELIVDAVIGIIIILAAYAITSFIVTRLVAQTMT